MNTQRCFRVNAGDNVATLLDDAEPGLLQVLGEGATGPVTLLESIRLGHKVALRDIQVGEHIVKFGVSIGQASAFISCGSWVHLHNVESEFDERSQTLDVRTGATTDTRYE